MRTLLKLSDACFLGVAAIFSAGFFLCVLLQVIYRYVLETPSPWTEELARYLFVWAAMLGAAVSVGRNDQFSISIFGDSLGARARQWLEYLIVVIGIAFALVMVFKGWAMASRMAFAVSPVLPVSQGHVYLVIPIAGAYMTLHLAWRLMGMIRGRVTWKDKTPW